MSKFKLKKLLKESEGLSRGEKFGLEEVGEQIVQAHKRLNAMLFKYMGGVKKYASNHRKNPELYKKLSDLYTHIKGNYYYTTKQAANKYLSSFEKQYKTLVSEGKLTEEDKEGKMAQGQLSRTVELASMLKNEFDVNTDLPEWVESKITKAEDYLSTVFDYMRGKQGIGEAMSRRIGGKKINIPQVSDFNGDMEKYMDALNKHMKEVEKLAKKQKKNK